MPKRPAPTRLKALGTRKFNRFANRKFRRPAPVLRVTDEALGTIAKVREALTAARASSKTGRRARSVALMNFEFARLVRTFERRAILLLSKGKRRRAGELLDKVDALAEDLDRTDRKAKALFRRARREAG